jgi:8-oxo-dGTP pyrophosphatase MutT (NUDIX family)
MTTDSTQLRKIHTWIRHLNAEGVLQVLLFKTVADRGSQWQPVCGWVEDGETPAKAALREAWEETGLTFPAGVEAQPVGYSFEFTSRWTGEHANPLVLDEGFSLSLSEERLPRIPNISLDPEEHVAARWYTYEKAMELLFHESHKNSLKTLFQPG